MNKNLIIIGLAAAAASATPAAAFDATSLADSMRLSDPPAVIVIPGSSSGDLGPLGHTDQGKAKSQASSVIPGGRDPFGSGPADGFTGQLDLFHIAENSAQEAIIELIDTAQDARSLGDPDRSRAAAHHRESRAPAGSGGASAIPAPGGAALLGVAALLAARRRRR